MSAAPLSGPLSALGTPSDRELESRRCTQAPNAVGVRIADMEARLRTMADQLIQRQVHTPLPRPARRSRTCTDHARLSNKMNASPRSGLRSAANCRAKSNAARCGVGASARDRRDWHLPDSCVARFQALESMVAELQRRLAEAGDKDSDDEGCTSCASELAGWSLTRRRAGRDPADQRVAATSKVGPESARSGSISPPRLAPPRETANPSGLRARKVLPSRVGPGACSAPT
jgi:hypothetical protein